MKKVLFALLFLTIAVGGKAQVTSLYENFDVCDSTADGHFPPGWTVFNVNGSQVWTCTSTHGVNGGPCIKMNGYQSSADHANEDWLITPKVNLSATTGTVYFEYSSSWVYSGDTLKVFISTDYSGTGDPTTSATHWTALAFDNSALNDSGNYQLFKANVSSAYRTTPFYVAFKYISTDLSGQLLDVDSVFTSNTKLGVESISESKVLPLTVLGDATQDQINLSLTAEKAGTYHLSIFDMMGRMVYRREVAAEYGTQNVLLNNLNLPSSMYIIKVENENSFGQTKALVK